MHSASEACESFDTLVSPHSARSTKKSLVRARDSQSAILSAKPALLTNHQQSEISSVRRVQSFSRTDKLVVPLFPRSVRASVPKYNSVSHVCLHSHCSNVTIYFLIM